MGVRVTSLRWIARNPVSAAEKRRRTKDRGARCSGREEREREGEGSSSVLESVSRRGVLVSTSRVGNRFGGSCSCNARACIRIGASRARTHTPVEAAACVQRRRILRTNVLYRPRYWSKYSDAFTYLKTRAGLMCRRNGQLSPSSTGRAGSGFRQSRGEHFLLPGDR